MEAGDGMSSSSSYRHGARSRSGGPHHAADRAAGGSRAGVAAIRLSHCRRRDVLRARHSVVTAAADAAVGKSQAGIGRQLRSELKMLAALPVAQLRTQADDLARQLRELDVRIQQSNWEHDLME